MRTKFRIALLLIFCLAAARTLYENASRPHLTLKAPIARQHGYMLNHEAIQRAKMFTVLISAEGFGTHERGTGVLVDPTHVLTCAHVAVHDNDETWVHFYPGYVSARGKVVFIDRALDLAILEIDVTTNGAPVPVFQEIHHDGQPITIIGNILGSMKWFVGYGIISGENARDLYTDGLVRGGDSGGPWINDSGEVVALSDWGLEDNNGVNIGISGGVSAKTINGFLKRWKAPTFMDMLFGIPQHPKAPIK